jgi:ribonuclease Z
VPEGFHEQLPTFSYLGIGTPDAPPTLAYVVIGPRIRGKFDGKRAQELGIPSGPIRKQLINGETIKLKRKIQKVEDGVVKMIEVERTVTPEECVGESETPAVSAYSRELFSKTDRGTIGCINS